MLMEEAHHMYVGESGVARVIQRTCEVMREHKTDDPSRLRELGVVDLPTIQRYLNFHYSVTLDLFGADVSSNAATFYSTGLKGRFEENRIQDDHVLKEQTYPVLQAVDGVLTTAAAPALNALNEKLRDDYIKDSVSGVGRWNKVVQKSGVEFRLAVPHKGFNRQIGALAGLKIAPDGRIVSAADWHANVHAWLPTEEDRMHVRSLMGRVTDPGKFANWIAPPEKGVNKKEGNFEYIRFA
jgi:benzoyl-CoA 2,3-dioxygenase component B